MGEKISKGELAIELSKLKGFEDPKVRSEQYATPSEIAAEVLWNAYLLGDIRAKVSVDLGCGTGILGLGAAILGAKRVYLVESESSVLKIAKENHEILKNKGKSESSEVIFVNKDMADFEEKADIVVQNPPFGTKVRHADREFLKKAVELAPIVYSFHKSESKGFIEAFSGDNGFEVSHRWDFDFPLKNTMKHHKSRIKRIKVSCFRLESKEKAL